MGHGKVMYRSHVEKEDCRLRMERSRERETEIKTRLSAEQTKRIQEREVYRKGIDARYSYEGYEIYKTADVKNDLEGSGL